MGERKVISKMEDLCKIFVSAAVLWTHGRRRALPWGGTLLLVCTRGAQTHGECAHPPLAGMVAPCDMAVTASHTRTRFVVPLHPLLCYAPLEVPCAVWLRRASAPCRTCERLRASPAHPEGAWYAIPALDLWPLPARSR